MLDKAPLFVTLSPTTEVATGKCTLPCPVVVELALVSGGPSLPGTAGQREWPQLFAGQGGDVQAGARRGLLAPSPRGAASLTGLHARCTQVIHTVPEPRQAGRCFLMERCAYFVKKHPLAPRRFFPWQIVAFPFLATRKLGVQSGKAVSLWWRRTPAQGRWLSGRARSIPLPPAPPSRVTRIPPRVLPGKQRLAEDGAGGE